jgi:DUF1365 family protein
MALVDIDQVEAQMQASRWTSVNRFNWASFDDRDHVGAPGRPLRERLQDSAMAAGVTLPDGPVYLLTHLRYLGYAFNPISFYYCYDRAGALRAVMNEVHSTFGEQRCYWIAVDPATRDAAQPVRHRTAKTLRVSPFMPMEIDWEFVLTEPADHLVAHMNAFQRADAAPDEPADVTPRFDATLTLERRPWTAREIHRVLRRHPAMTVKVIAAIHWEALRLWWKGVPFQPAPAPPSAPVAAKSTSETHA